MSITYLALGSNLVNRLKNIRTAIDNLSKTNIIVLKTSSVYETSAYGFKDQPNFLNAVIKCKTKYNPVELLKIIKKIESEMGRIITRRWGPRNIDIDILLYEDIILKEKSLTIPHNELKKRDFFLVPLLEIDNNLIDPETKIHLKDFLKNVDHHIIKSTSYNISLPI